MFVPRSVAAIGASKTLGNVGRALIENLRSYRDASGRRFRECLPQKPMLLGWLSPLKQVNLARWRDFMRDDMREIDNGLGVSSDYG
jgi:hypothetical protein